MSVRVRFAPSPSGDQHLGNIRTAIFNWLFARREGGTFVLRIEDTDPERSKPELFERVYEAIRWVGLDWDEGPDVGGPHGPYIQSQRRDDDAELLGRLEAEGKVYRCYCTREDVIARGTRTGYDRHCRTLTDEQREANAGRPYALRFAVPGRREVVLDDLIRGEVRTPYEELQDFVVARSDGSPTFVFANAVDDIAMEITHVIRGTDLLNAAASNILVIEALGHTPPRYAHVPLVLAPDRSRLGARHGAVGILEYRSEGYLAEAMFNFLTHLGWSLPSGEELFGPDEAIEAFTLDRVQSSPAVFDRDKLDWMNQEYIKRSSADDLVRRVLELAPDTPEDVLRQAVQLELVQTRVVRLAQIPLEIRYLHERPKIDPASAERFLQTEEADRTLHAAAERLGALEPWSVEAIKGAIQGVVEELGLHKRKGPQPIRVAISGTHVSLPLFESIWMIGREETVRRLRAAVTSG